jgi:hypothetical protein
LNRPPLRTGRLSLAVTSDFEKGKLNRRDAVCGTHWVVKAPRAVPLGLRWPVERTNPWLSNFGQMRRNTDRKMAHRLTRLALAITLIITAKLIDWRTRWSPA